MSINLRWFNKHPAPSIDNNYIALSALQAVQLLNCPAIENKEGIISCHSAHTLLRFI